MQPFTKKKDLLQTTDPGTTETFSDYSYFGRKWWKILLKILKQNNGKYYIAEISVSIVAASVVILVVGYVVKHLDFSIFFSFFHFFFYSYTNRN